MIEGFKDGLHRVILNRLIIAILSAVGGVFVTTFPQFATAFCGG